MDFSDDLELPIIFKLAMILIIETILDNDNSGHDCKLETD